MVDSAASQRDPDAGRAGLLADVTRRLLAAGQPEEIAQELLAHVAAHLALDFFLFYLCEPHARSLRLLASIGVSSDEGDRVARLPLVEAHGTRDIAGDAAERLAEIARQAGLRAWAWRLVLGSRGLAAAVAAGSRARGLDDADIEVAEAAAIQLSLAIERVRAVAAWEGEARGRHKLEAALAKTKESLKESIQQRRVALEIAQLGTWEFDLETGEVRGDERSGEMFGFDPSAGYRLEDLLSHVHDEDRERVRREIVAAVSPPGSGIYETEYRVEAAPGRVRRILARGRAVRTGESPPGRRVRFTGTVMDVTALRQAEQALREANARLAEADRRKDEFIAILSHELRNPLAPIRFALPSLQHPELPRPVAQAAAVIHRQVNHMTRLVDDLLDASRIGRGKIELRRDIIPLASVVTAAIEAASPGIHAARHALRLDLEGEQVTVYGDSARLAQAVTNLLNNSAKYTPRGGEISVSARREGDEAVIRVRDSGVGMTPEVLGTVFDMFDQGNRPQSQGGLGIGLALAKQLVVLHGGTIEARSEGIGRGSEFTVRLPLADAAPPREAQPSAGSPVPSRGRSLKVLVVDDNADLVEMLATLVSAFGHDVRKAMDGHSAIAAALSFRPDLVFLDLGLPVLSGLEVARELRRHPEMAGTRLVALTGWGNAEDRRNTKDAGFDEHLIKPADAETVGCILAQLSSRPGRAGR